MRLYLSPLLCLFMLPASLALAKSSPVPDTPFIQEYRENYISGNPGIDTVRAITVDGEGGVWIASSGGLYRLVDGQWVDVVAKEQQGPAYSALTASDGSVWLGAWDGLHHVESDGLIKHIIQPTGEPEDRLDRIMSVPRMTYPISALCETTNGIAALGPDGLWHAPSGDWELVDGDWPMAVRDVATDSDGSLWLATGYGFYQIRGTKVVRRVHDVNEILSPEVSTVACAPDGTLWVGGNRGIDVYDNGKRVRSFMTKDGLPHPDVRALAFHSDGTLWVATAVGAARFAGARWSLRHSVRWVPSDDVRDVAFDAEGTAWIATAKGVSAIKRRTMTLEEKAAYYHDIAMDRQVREPYFVAHTELATPGDLSTAWSKDDDNDGQHTNMHLAMEAFRYAVTKNPQARENALKAFNAMVFLQEVTGTEGFIARTAVPLKRDANGELEPIFSVHDRHPHFTQQELAERAVYDPRFRPVSPNWRVSDDEKWFWKGQTSSDEVTGHFYGYYHYYKLIAETEAEKERVRAIVRRVMDYIIDGGYVFRDVDGEPTRWGVWAPEILNHDPDWASERAINSVEILSYLKVAHHITGDAKYQREYRRLIDEYGYAEQARKPQPINPGQRTYIDSLLLSLFLPGLIHNEDDPELLAKYQEGVRHYYSFNGAANSPLYNFACGSVGLEDFGLESSIEFLRDTPLDCVEWNIDNTKREDIELVREPIVSEINTSRLLPPSERGVMRWDGNPFAAIRGAAATREADVTYWLLPYWMGRYYVFIDAPSK